MRWNIITNLSNGGGLQRDFTLVKTFLESRGHDVQGLQFNAGQIPAHMRADRNLFLETLPAGYYGLAREQWIIPNPEWTTPRMIHETQRGDFKYVIAKTWDAFNILKGHGVHQSKLRYTGFMSRDLYDQKVLRQRKFLHVAGKSKVKNTPAILEAWERLPIAEPLTVVADFVSLNIPKVTFVRKLTEEKLVTYMNSHAFHILPSAYEGFGHSIHEGMSCGAVVLTMNQAPMNNFGTPKELLLDSTHHFQYNLAPMHVTNSAEVYKRVKMALAIADLTPVQKAARAAFEAANSEFEKCFGELL